MSRIRLLVVNAVLLLTVVGCWWGRNIEAASIPGGDFLQPLQLGFRNWKATEVPLTERERSLLQPDAVVIRDYRGKTGELAQLAVIAGHRKETVHTPAFCMAGGGWELLEQRDVTLRLPSGPVPAVRAVMTREGQRVLLTYFFTDGAYSTRSLIRFQGAQLLKRFSAAVPVGALVRVMVPITGDPARAEQLSDEFAAETLPPVLASLRDAG